jgi:hypothetical protein
MTGEEERLQSRAWSDAAVAKGNPEPLRAGGRLREGLPQSLWREPSLANTLISGFYTPELSEEKFLLFSATRFTLPVPAALGNECGIPPSMA